MLSPRAPAFVHDCRAVRRGIAIIQKGRVEQQMRSVRYGKNEQIKQTRLMECRSYLRAECRVDETRSPLFPWPQRKKMRKKLEKRLQSCQRRTPSSPRRATLRALKSLDWSCNAPFYEEIESADAQLGMSPHFHGSASLGIRHALQKTKLPTSILFLVQRMRSSDIVLSAVEVFIVG